MSKGKDPKTKVISLKEFFDSTDFLLGIPKKSLWNESTTPQIDEIYYKVSSDQFARISFSGMLINFGTDMQEKLESIVIAKRDGITEYRLSDDKIAELRKQAEHHKRSVAIPLKIKRLTRAEKQLPPFAKDVTNISKPLSSYLNQTGYKALDRDLAKKFVVFDVETNGLRKAHDDLLSLSIYDPVTGICFNRFFPLDAQPVVLTTAINGITEQSLAGSSHMTQPELDELIAFFGLKDRTLLSYSGGRGLFDSSFVLNYCKRHSLTGFKNLKYQNIKSLFPIVPFGFEGTMKKDDLCSILGISGVREIHTGENDCVLEWKLFEKIGPTPLLCIQERLYRYDKRYIVPVTYLPRHPELVKIAQINLPKIRARLNPVFKYEFPKSALVDIQKFPTNITGIAIENAIDSALHVEKQDNYSFLSENRSHLQFLGSLMVRLHEIPVITEDDGTLRAVDKLDETYISDVNRVTQAIMPCLASTIDYIKMNIFPEERILSQEMVISNDRKVLALCDLSSKTAILEIKTYEVEKEKTDQGSFADSALTNQLYFQKRDRKEFVFSLSFDVKNNPRTFVSTLAGLVATIYQVNFVDVSSSESYEILPFIPTAILRKLQENPSLRNKDLEAAIPCSSGGLRQALNRLVEGGYIKRVGTPKSGYWKILKNEKGADIISG